MAGQLTAFEVASLRKALEQCDAETKRFIQPILKYDPVQKALLSFLRDDSKSFEEWIWDPAAHQALSRFRGEVEEESSYKESLNEQVSSKFVSAVNGFSDQRETDLEEAIQTAKLLKEDGSERFKEGNSYAAGRLYERAVDALEPLVLGTLGREEACRTGDTMELRNEAASLYVVCCSNAALSAMKSDSPSQARVFANKALHVNKCWLKAWYIRAKANLLLSQLDDALSDANLVLEREPNNKEALSLRARIEKKLREKSRLVQQYYKDQEKEEERDKKEDTIELGFSTSGSGTQRRPPVVRVISSGDKRYLPLELPPPATPSAILEDYLHYCKREYEFILDEDTRGPSYLFTLSLDGSKEPFAEGARKGSKKEAKNDCATQAIRRMHIEKPELIPPPDYKQQLRREALKKKLSYDTENKEFKQWENHEKWDEERRKRKPPAALVHEDAARYMLELEEELLMPEGPDKPRQYIYKIDGEVAGIGFGEKKQVAKEMAARQALEFIEKKIKAELQLLSSDGGDIPQETPPCNC